MLLLSLSLALPAAHAAVHYQRLKSFGFPDQAGVIPAAPVIEGSNGVLYGTTYAGGSNNAGTVFRLNRDGTGYRALHQFIGTSNDGVNPFAGLVEGNDGALYGTTVFGGNSNAGTAFKLNKDGSDYIVLHHFGSGDRANPGGLLAGGDGTLYGTTGTVGSGQGTVFKLNTDGSGYCILHDFGSVFADGYQPAAALMEGRDGALYGTASLGGTNSGGTVFRLNKNGSGYSTLHSFSASDVGYHPAAGLVEGGDGALYGTTVNESIGLGTVFKLRKDGSGYTNLHTFGIITGDAGNPRAPLIAGKDGMLYGTTQYGTVFKLNQDGSGYTILHNFTDLVGENPIASLTEASDGSLYGTTASGGSQDDGRVFSLDPDGSGFTIVHSFTTNGGDGSNPRAPLVEGSNGALYGSTATGGANGGGALFKLNKDGNGYSILYSFGGILGDGSSPQTALIEASDGALFGTTSGGGTYDVGTIFALNKDGSGYRVLLSFTTNRVSGQNPSSALLEGSDGALYGATVLGGRKGLGTLFALSKDGTGYQVLHSFTDTGGDGKYPDGDLVKASDGALYGTTELGGDGNFGTVFKLTKDGHYRVVYSFAGTDNPSGGLVEGSDGALYGTTSEGGLNGFGAVFKLNKDGSGYTILHRFENYAAGVRPRRLVEGADGSLYGTTAEGGNAGWGTIFRLNKDGSEYGLLFAFGATDADGRNPEAGLVKATDGAFYGTTSGGGDLRQGTLFRLLPPQTPSMISAHFASNVALVSFTGLGGYRYEVSRSTNLAQWTALAEITMPPDGVYTNLDSTPPNAAAFYRAAWLP